MEPLVSIAFHVTAAAEPLLPNSPGLALALLLVLLFACRSYLTSNPASSTSSAAAGSRAADAADAADATPPTLPTARYITDEALTPSQREVWEGLWAEKPWSPHNLSKADVLRALVAFDFDVHAARRQLGVSAAWVERMQPATITAAALPNTLPSRAWLFGGHTTEGWPIVEVYVSRWTPWKFPTDEHSRLAAFVFEKAQVLSSDTDRYCLLFDMRGWNLARATPHALRLIYDVVWIAQGPYCERLGAAYLLNVPTIFQLTWVLIKPLLRKSVAARVFLFGNDWRPFVREHIEDKNLPQTLGGLRPEGTVPH